MPAHPSGTALPPAAIWAKVRAMGDIQFTPLTPVAQPVQPPPEWLRALGAWLARWFGPAVAWLAQHWRVIEIAGALGAVAVAGWMIWAAWRSRQPSAKRPEPPPAWQPDAVIAQALLADADALAAAGRYDEAAHLLLRRSFDDIAATRPDWLTPASTAREIAHLRALPAAARQAFAVIAGEVERSRYALRALGQADWQRARAAYAGFAVAAA